MNSTPRELGYRMPAEWEPHAATWLSWPHNKDSWPGKFDSILPIYARLVAALAESEPVHINVNDLDMEKQARCLLHQLGARGEIHFHHFATNDAWCRDHGAIFVTRQGQEPRLAAVQWEFNAWGEKYPHHLDRQIASQMAHQLEAPSFAPRMILEGGSIEVNGIGDLLTTESCLLNTNRNRDRNREQIEQVLCDYLGVKAIHWLGDGIEGDDTDGHVDDVSRFVALDTIVTAVESNPDDPNYVALTENLMRLRSLESSQGKPFTIVELPMPPALFGCGSRLPASYANFYIANRIVLVPGFDQRTDAVARDVLQQLFPTREVVVIDCSDLVWGLGAFHCLTQQVPALV